MMSSNQRAAIAEMIGTFMVVLCTSGAVVANGLAGLSQHQGIGKVGIAAAAGASWAVALAFTVRISGGFLNPAITVTLWVFGRLDSLRAGLFIGAQLIGGLLAGLVLRGLFFFRESDLLDTRLGTPHLHLNAYDVSAPDRGAIFGGIGAEAMLVFLFTLAALVMVYDPRFRRAAGEAISRLTYLWLGLLVGAETLVTYDLTGAGINPARWLGTVTWESTVAGLQERGPWSDHGPYWIGPLLGAMIAGVVATFIILPPDHRKGPPPAGMP